MNDTGPLPPSIACGDLAKIGFFSDLGPEALAEIAPLAETLFAPAGTVLFRHGETHGGVIYVIRSGSVRQAWPDGRTRERHPGEVLGIAGYLDNRPHGSTVTALTDGEFVQIPAQVLRRLEVTSSAVSSAMNRSIAENIHHHATKAMEKAPLSGLSVFEAMSAPLVSCRPDTTLREASRSMRERRIGSIAIIDGEDKPIGVLTWAELFHAVSEMGLSGEDKVTSVGYRHPHGIDTGASLRQAEYLQEIKGTKYLIVTRDGKPTGILSQTDILHTVAKVSPPLLADVQRAEHLTTLYQLQRRLPRFAADIRNWNRGATATIRILSEIHHAILRRCVALTLSEFVHQGRGAPPAPFALVLLGSGGRSEMMLTPDQDNAIILADETGEDAAAMAWFAEFTDRVNRHMAEVGYALCPGGIMAREPAWRKTLSGWLRQFGHVTAHPNPKGARWANIILDLRFLYGDEDLVRELRRGFGERLRENPRLLRLMVEDDAGGRPPLGLFDRLITKATQGKKRHVDLKRNAIRLVADAARIYAWRAGLDVNNTVDRFRALARQGSIDDQFVKTTLAAYDALLDLHLEQRLQRALKEKDMDDKLLDYDLLSPHEQELLRISLRAVKRLQKRLQEDFEVDI